MARAIRSKSYKPSEIAILHVICKASRHLFLFEDNVDPLKSYGHRRDWIIDRMLHLCSYMAIDVLNFSLLGNHMHHILRSRPDIVAKWSDREVVRRWLTLCPARRIKTDVDGKTVYQPLPPRDIDIDRVLKNPARVAKIRSQLSDISWFMRLLKQYIAQRANKEDGKALGHFWCGRFKAIRIEDELHLIACALYVDLNPIRAAMAQSLEEYDYTSARVRLERLRRMRNASEKDPAAHSPPDPIPTAEGTASSDSKPIALTEQSPAPRKEKTFVERCAFLSALRMETLSSDVEESKTGFRCSDKGFLTMSDKEYLDLLQWCVENKITDKDSEPPAELPKPLESHRGHINALWGLVKNFSRLVKHTAGAEAKDCLAWHRQETAEVSETGGENQTA